MVEMRITEAGPTGMITLRGDLADEALRDACTGLTGGAFPEKLGTALADQSGLFWMSPDELLILLPKAQVPDALATLRDSLAGRHHLAVDVSDARALFEIKGPWVRELLAKLTPADVSPAAFGPGTIRRSRLGQVAAAFWMPTETTARVVCFRSVGRYMRELLEVSAEAGPVGVF